MVVLKYPETAIWFHHPIWNIFNFDSRSAIETDKIILSLAPEVSRHFLHLAERSSFELRFVKRIFGGVSKSMLTLNEAIIDVKKG
ncbi:hypothetical protein [Acinetobacter haemolyticus]|nr:hypothetical protein [Acinetobacter haemolyticus]SUU17043.1 Uncharacterised protein [Acinetobacter haemolyticus]